VFRSVCLIGLTGHGKSHTCNTLSKSDAFKVSAGIDSETEKVFGVVTRWRKEPKGIPCIIIDTPGIGDSKGRDTANIASMVVDLKTIGYVHTFIIAINSEEPRMSEHL
jgi:predicted GTPase